MSELLDNSKKRKELLKHMILQLHEGQAPDEVRNQLVILLKKIPYGEVVEVEQELISDGILADSEILKFCDLHSKALEGHIDHSGAKPVPWGHPVDTFKRENQEIRKVIAGMEGLLTVSDDAKEISRKILQLKSAFHQLMDVDKHYIRKENLLFPFLEKKGITGPPKVMWGKHDEIREKLKAALEALDASDNIQPEEFTMTAELIFRPAMEAVEDMIMKEEEILFPMSMDKLTESEWYEVYQQTPEIGFCLFDPMIPWKPEGADETALQRQEADDLIHLPSGSFTREELQAILNTLPIDVTFVNKDEKVRYFSQGKERIFQRSRAILNRDVKMCHPPASMHVVEKILDDFKNGREESAPFWIQMKGRFIHIEYFALKNEKGEFLGTLEVSQDLTDKRALQGEQRLLTYATPLRTEAGQTMEITSDQPSDTGNSAPAWISTGKTRISIDARPIIQSGGHPLEEVFKESALLGSNEMIELITPFLPVPLIEKMKARGFECWSKQEEGTFFSYFYKK